MPPRSRKHQRTAQAAPQTRPDRQAYVDGLTTALDEERVAARVSRAVAMDIPLGVTVRLRPANRSTMESMGRGTRARGALPVPVSSKLVNKRTLEAIARAEVVVLDWLANRENAAAFVVDPLGALESLRPRLDDALGELLVRARENERRDSAAAPGVRFASVVATLDLQTDHTADPAR